MNFDLSAEQQIIQDSVSRFVREHYELEMRQKLATTAQGFSEQHWQHMAQLGWLGLAAPEADGGFGGNQIDTMLLMEQFGQGLVLEPYLASIVLGANALCRSGNRTLKEAILPQVFAGQQHLTLAWAEAQAGYDLNDVATRAVATDSGYTLDGVKCMVPNAASAKQIVVSARTAGERTDLHGISLFVVDAEAPGVEVTGFPTVDGMRAAEVKLTGVEVSAAHLLGQADAGYELLLQVAIDGMLALSAEAVGIMEMLYKDTVQYTQEREQFDHPLAQFQVVQHRLVDMFMEYEQSKSLLYRATLEVQQSGLDALRTVHALKYHIGKAGAMIAENAVQLHGGMGMTEELRIAHYFKRLLVIDTQFGSSDYHLQKFAG